MEGIYFYIIILGVKCMTQEEMKEYISYWLDQNKINKEQLVFQVSFSSTNSKGRKKPIVDKTVEIIDDGHVIDLSIYEGVIGKRKSFFRLHSKEQVVALASKHTATLHMETEYEKV
jgi:hypothetical protein